MRLLVAAMLAVAACKRVAPPPAPPPPAWRWENPRPQGNTLTALHSDGARLIAVGEGGTILVSEDGGATFTQVQSGTSDTLTDVTADGGGVVVVGMHGTILASNDRRLFAPMKSPTAENLEGVWANGHGRIFAVGASGTILRSTNGGAMWTPVISGTEVTLRAIGGTVHDEIFAVGDTGTVLVAEDNAPVWTRRAVDTREDLYAVWVGPEGQVVAAGGATVVRSDDRGQTFKPFAAGRGLLGLGGTAGDLWACGTGGALLRSRDAGQTFTPVSTPATDTFTAAAPVGEAIVFAGTFGALARWKDSLSALAAGSRARLNAVSGDLAVGVDGTVLARRDGAYVPVESGVRVELTAVASEGRKAVIVGAGGVMLQGSPSERMLPVRSGSERLLTGVALHGERVVAVADDGSVLEGGAPVATAPAPLRAVHLSAEVAVAVGDSGTIFRASAAGWTVAPSGTTADLWAVWGRGREVIAAGRRGTILRSMDGGASWSPVASPVPADLTAVSGDASQIVVAGERGLLLRATGSSPFTVEPSGTTNDLHGVSLEPGRQVVVGAGGTILTR